MVQINAKIDDELVRKFRHVVYTKNGLKKGDFKKAIEEAMIDYIKKYSESKPVREMAERAKSRNYVDED